MHKLTYTQLWALIRLVTESRSQTRDKSFYNYVLGSSIGTGSVYLTDLVKIGYVEQAHTYFRLTNLGYEYLLESDNLKWFGYEY